MKTYHIREKTVTDYATIQAPNIEEAVRKYMSGEGLGLDDGFMALEIREEGKKRFTVYECSVRLDVYSTNRSVAENPDEE